MTLPDKLAWLALVTVLAMFIIWRIEVSQVPADVPTIEIDNRGALEGPMRKD